jgi:exodeoxyribonuclease V beta subunit
LLDGRAACSEAAGDAWLDHLERRREAGLALIGPLVGVLTGSIDLVFRAKGRDGVERYYLADYKTNRVGPTAGHYGSAWLAWEMAHAGYPLQSLLYTVALHQHLGTRRPSNYLYELHFGGFFYLFVRGMGGTSSRYDERSGLPLGVHAGRWPARVVERVTRALGLPVVGFATPNDKEAP